VQLAVSLDGTVFAAYNRSILEYDPKSKTLVRHSIPVSSINKMSEENLPASIKGIYPATAVAVDPTSRYVAVALEHTSEVQVLDRESGTFDGFSLAANESAASLAYWHDSRLAVGVTDFATGLSEKLEMRASTGELLASAVVRDASFITNSRGVMAVGRSQIDVVAPDPGPRLPVAPVSGPQFHAARGRTIVAVDSSGAVIALTRTGIGVMSQNSDPPQLFATYNVMECATGFGPTSVPSSEPAGPCYEIPLEVIVSGVGDVIWYTMSSNEGYSLYRISQ
jgi:hypothetical protein